MKPKQEYFSNLDYYKSSKNIVGFAWMNKPGIQSNKPPIHLLLGIFVVFKDLESGIIPAVYLNFNELPEKT